MQRAQNNSSISFPVAPLVPLWCSLCRHSREACAIPGGRAVLALILALPLWFAGCSSSTAPIDRTADVSAGTVTVVIDMGETTLRREVQSVPEGTTVAQVMAEITDPPVKLTGSGAMTFVEAIGDLDTSGDGGWTFRVDGERADRSVGVYRLSPPAEVQWSHTSHEKATQQRDGP